MVVSWISRDNCGDSSSLSTNWVNQLMAESFNSTRLSRINPHIFFSMTVTLIISDRHHLSSFELLFITKVTYNVALSLVGEFWHSVSRWVLAHSLYPCVILRVDIPFYFKSTTTLYQDDVCFIYTYTKHIGSYWTQACMIYSLLLQICMFSISHWEKKS